MSLIKSYPAWALTEYSIPLSEYPVELHKSWKPWLDFFIDSSAEKCQDILKDKLAKCSSVLNELKNNILNHRMTSLYVYKGTPYWRMNNIYSIDHFISLPPFIEIAIVHTKLAQLGFDSNSLLSEFFAYFGAMCQQIPCNSVKFAGLKNQGDIELELAKEDFNAGLEFLNETERIQRQSSCEKWWNGLQIMKGGDGQYWHLGIDGSICWHECGSSEIGDFFPSLEEFIYCFVEASTEQVLFEGGYSGEKILECMRKK